MQSTISERTKFENFDKEYKQYIEELRRKWLSKNQVKSNSVYEVMHPHEREEVNEKIREWEQYITPLAEAWWRKRGYGVKWPVDNSKPMQVFLL